MSLWDVYQHMQLRGVRTAQHASDRESLARDHRQEERIDEVDDRVDRLLVLTEALWQLCRDRLGMSDDDLSTAVQALLDQRAMEAAAGPLRCTSCQAAVPRDMERCQYCGTPTGVERRRIFTAEP
jgi:hypothetical protein